MKKLLLILIIIILLIFGYNQYQNYVRFNGPETTYIENKEIDTNYHNKDFLFNYYNAITKLNSFVKLQWSSNKIDLINPKKENTKTKYALEKYSKKLATVKYYEKTLIQSKELKSKGFNNLDIKNFENKGVSLSNFKNSANIDKHYNILRNNISKEVFKLNQKNPFVFEIQKLLSKQGFTIKIDGIYKTETLEALKSFEQKNNLLPDGKIDAITLEHLLMKN